MADSNISIVGLQATGGVNQIVLQWAVNDPNVNGLPYFRFDIAEIWASPASTMSGEAKIGEASTAFVHLPLSRGDKRYYRVRPRDLSGRLGDFTDVVNATEISGDVLLASNGYWKHPSGLYLQWGNASVTGFANVPFPITFPNACFAIVAIPRTVVPLVIFNFLRGFNRVSFDYLCVNNSGGDASTSIQWLAVGY